MFERITKLGWRVVEAALLLVVLCVLFNIILGKESGAFISSVAANALQFIQGMPPGAFLGIVLLLAIYWIVKSRIIPPTS
ncbi:MAG: hypothetical protein EXR04_05585 [Rhodospirillales bacterium]|nr:hypothetical protein [Rhodospirillales bacterium]